MITSFEAKLKLPQDFNLNVNMASNFHGIIMELTESAFAEKMHAEAMRPYSQYLYKNAEDQWVWRVNTLNEYAKENIIDRLVNVDSILMKHKNVEINILSHELYQTSFDELFKNDYINGKKSKYVSIRFETPTAFKSDGRYVNYPNLRLIMNSLINKYDSNSEMTDISDEDFINELMSRLEIVEYNLRSRFFYLEGIRIPAFAGKIKIKINSNQNLIGLVNMLFDFAQYSGVGIKTALGMGAVRVINENKV